MAYLLLKETNIHPMILEESNTLGGLAQTVIHHGNRMDLGGHRFFSKDQRIRDLWEELLPLQGSPAHDDKFLNRKTTLKEQGPDPEQTDRAMLLRSRLSRILYLRKFFAYPIALKPETFLNMGLSRTLNASMGYLKAMLHKQSELSLEDFMINRFGRPLYEMFFEDYTQKVWGKHPREIDARWGAQRIKGLSLRKALFNALHKSAKVETSLIEEFWYPKLGPGQLWEVMAEEIRRMGGEIRLQTSVEGLIQQDGHVKSLHITTQGQRSILPLKNALVISSMPIRDLITGMQNVPRLVQDIAKTLPYRDFMTVGLLVSKLNLRNTTRIPTLGNIVPDNWIYVQERDVRLGRVQIFNNWSPYLVADPQNTVWLGLEYFCDEGDELWSMDDPEFIQFASAELEKLGFIEARNILDSVRIKVKKAYPAYWGSYCYFDHIKDFLCTFDNLYCIGRNGQHRYNNMDHSMLTALQALEVIKNPSLGQSVLWQVNAEEEYHEATQFNHTRAIGPEGKAC